MSGIVWIASYPKSGNTWVRILLANYLRGGDEPVNINDLGDAFWYASARALFDEWVGVEASTLDQVTIDRLRPAVYRRLVADRAETAFVKVHDAWARNDRGQSIFPPDVTTATVYIVRNPLDMAVSSAYHRGIEIEQVVKTLGDPTHAVSDSVSRLADQLRQFLGSWSDHVRSWLDQSRLPCHLVRYEDLRDDPKRVLAGVVATCGLSIDEARLERAIGFSDFEELQRQEQERGFRERPLNACGSFFRRGEVGSWREELSPDLADRLVESHRAMMVRLGYLAGCE